MDEQKAIRLISDFLCKISSEKFKFFYHVDRTKNGDSLEIENEFGSRAFRDLNFLTYENIQTIINELRSEMYRMDYDKYRESILGRSAQNMIAL